MLARVASVLLAAIVGTHWLGLGEHAVFVAIAIGNVAGAVVLGVLFVATQRRAGAHDPRSTS